MTLAAALLVLSAVGGARGGTPAPRPARDLVSEAAKQAKSSHRTVLVVFHASWCGWCKRLDAMLEAPELKKAFADSFVVTRLDVMEQPDKEKALENPGGRKLLADLGGERSGLPFYAFLDGAGKKLADSNAMPGGQNIGYPGTAGEIAAFEKLLKQTAPRMTAGQRAKVVEYLKKGSAG